MTDEVYKWSIGLVKERYSYLDLDFEQAERIYRYEEEKNISSDKHFLSVWEEWDYELHLFNQFLTEAQTKLYRDYYNQRLTGYIEGLMEQDKESLKDIAYQEDLIDFYETRFFPEFFKKPFQLYIWQSLEKTKVQYLKTEYKRCLTDAKKEILSQHFRHNRIYKPNELKAALLRHKFSHMVPDYLLFRNFMDEPTKAVVSYLVFTLRSSANKARELISSTSQQLKAFNEANFKKHFGERTGWHTEVVRLLPGEEEEQNLLFLLLLDKDNYGFREV